MWDCEKLDDEEKQNIGTDGKTKPDPPGESHSYSYALSMSTTSLMWNTAKKCKNGSVEKTLGIYNVSTL